MELRTYLQVLRRGWAMILVGLLAGTVVALVQLVTTSSTYTAKTSLFVAAGQSRTISELQQSAEIAQNAASTFARILDSGSDSRLVSQSPRPPGTPLDTVTAEAPTRTTVVEITVTGTDPVAVAGTANATAANSARLLTLPQSRGNGPPLVTLFPLAPALPPATATGPLADRVLTLDVAVGLAAGLAVAYLVFRLDRRLHRREEVQAVTAVPILASVPRSSHRGTGPPGGLASAVEESARVIRASLLHGGADRSGRVVLCPVTRRPRGGADPAVALARVLAESGRQVVLVDADLEEPLAGVDPDQPGLTDVLAHRVQALHAPCPTSHPQLSLLSVGLSESDTRSIDDLRAVESVTRTLERVYEQIVVRAPPVLTDPDATVMSAVMRRAVVVVEIGRTRDHELAGALEALVDTGADVLGIVLLERRRRRPREVEGTILRDRSGSNSAFSSSSGTVEA